MINLNSKRKPLSVRKNFRLFAKYGFEIESTIDTSGVDLSTLDAASDFKIFVLKKYYFFFFNRYNDSNHFTYYITQKND